MSGSIAARLRWRAQRVGARRRARARSGARRRAACRAPGLDGHGGQHRARAAQRAARQHGRGGDVRAGGECAHGKRLSRLLTRGRARRGREGTRILRKAGWDPGGLASFLEAARATARKNPTALDVFFSTHPADGRSHRGASPRERDARLVRSRQRGVCGDEEAAFGLAASAETSTAGATSRHM